jgi:alanyl-tRNA synthetase
MTADVLRDKFLAFFKAKKHKIIESDSLVPKDDPTVLFTPAGMNQFKKEFMGFDSGFKRAATAQRCLRTDDLDKVGRTSSHHTFFEMLGNFSFGDYFKDDAISWAWEFLIKELKIDQAKLWVSVYQNDDEAYSIWKDKIKIPQHKIIKLGDKDNFWPAEAKTKGPNGPCGPCSEIFYDFGPSVGCLREDCDPSCSCGRFVEIWNLVFTQFNRKDDATLEALPNKNIDTGMGLERLAAVMQGKQNNFETELFQPIIKEIRRYVETKTVDITQLLYAIADHLRAIVFSSYDGISPSNEGRGYIVRKIIRKSILHLRSLGIDKPFLNKLVGQLAQIMQKPYPDLKDRQEDIAQVILEEERNFIHILNTSESLIASGMEKVPQDPNDLKKDGLIFASATTSTNLGIFAFNLYDTNGIPLEITKDAIERKYKLDSNFEIAYQNGLNKQRELSKSFSKMKGDVFKAKGPELKLTQTKFIGYKEYVTQAKITAILKEGKEVNEVLIGQDLQLVLDQTPFYAESGGQIGDTGELINGKNIFEVLDTQKIDNVILHIGKIKSGIFKVSDNVVAKINVKRRLAIARNHTATHILQAALRKVLGNHVQQQGSLVGEEKFRFDFAHFKGLSQEEISRVEEVANSYIANDYKVTSREIPLRDAKKSGALAFFEEKYGEKVRVVDIGDISKELCAGTHLAKIREIGTIKIISESSVASGIRRIEAVTAEFAERFIKDQQKKASEESQRKDKLKEQKNQEKKRNAEMDNIINQRLPAVIDKSVKVNGINTVFSLEDDLDMPALRSLADMVKEKLNQAVIVLGSKGQMQKNAFLVIAVSQDLLSRGLDAVALIRQVAGFIGGSGGGRKDFAQAGGANAENLTLAFDKLRDIINKLI